MATVAERILALAALTTPAAGDALAIVDVSDTGMAATGTTKHITLTDFFGGVPVNIVQGNALNIQTDKVRARDGDGLYLVDDGDNGLFIEDGGTVFLGDIANTKMTLGLTINQGGNDDEILALKSSDVAHGVTNVAETDTFFRIIKAVDTTGGAELVALTDGGAKYAFDVRGIAAAVDTDKTTVANAPVKLVAQLANGVAPQPVSADGNLACIRNEGTTRFIFDAEGSAHADVEWVAFDDCDDIALLNALELEFDARKTVTQEFGKMIGENKDLLQEAGIVNFYDDGPRAMVNWTRLNMLMVGALRQLGAKMGRYEQALLNLGVSPKLLEA